MGAYSVAIAALFLGLLGVVVSQEDCTTTGFKLGNPRCPSGTREVFREEAFGQKIKFCCRPGTLDEANYNKVARRCRVTRCAQPTANPCSSLYTRVYNGETLTYEEVSRDTCTTSVLQKQF
ncbi:unnamed protein product [Orchesella dallaii]|uniref:Uncharacterized protein n=1 Tax=Orchesella dallaii TaxID=48710 RepID=A0ABP1RUS3_9HEXA